MTIGLLQVVGLADSLFKPALTGEQECQREQRDAQIEPERGVPDVPIIERALFLGRYEVAAIDLRPAGNSRADHEPQVAVLRLILWQERPRPDQ